MAPSNVLLVGLFGSIDRAQASCVEPHGANCVEPYLHSESNDDPWMMWKLQYGKTYESAEEELIRRNVWTEGTARMMNRNEQQSFFTLSWNAFSDLTDEEHQARFRGRIITNTSATKKLGTTHRGVYHHGGRLTDLPSDWDWSGTDVVTEVKTQHCGDCWAFSAAATLEGALAVATGWTTSLSALQFVECSDGGTCDGGEEEDAMKWAVNNYVCSWDSYPETYFYYQYYGTCNTNCDQVITAGSIWGTYTVGSDEGSLCAALTQRPISIAVGADDTFSAYSGGILQYTYSGSINHAIVAVGYGYADDGTPYWKVRNSWGTSWGYDGYALLYRGSNQNQNGILDYPVGVYVYGPYNPSMSLTDMNGLRISAPVAAEVSV